MNRLAQHSHLASFINHINTKTRRTGMQSALQRCWERTASYNQQLWSHNDTKQQWSGREWKRPCSWKITSAPKSSSVFLSKKSSSSLDNVSSLLMVWWRLMGTTFAPPSSSSVATNRSQGEGTEPTALAARWFSRDLTVRYAVLTWSMKRLSYEVPK